MGFKISMAAARVNAKKTQLDIAKEMHLSKTTIVKWETGQVIPKPAQFAMYCQICGAPTDFVFLPNELTKS